MNSHKLPLLIATLVLIALAVPAGGALAKPGDPQVEVSPAVHQDVSPPLSTLSGPSAPGTDNHKEKPLRLLPGHGVGANPNDPVVQTNVGPSITTSAYRTFPGVGQGDYGFSDQYAPPDTNGAVGATQYVQWVNTDFAVFDKTTGAIASGFPKPGNSIWSGFGSGCETNNDGDPIAQYDKAANRWVMTQFSV